MELTYGKYGTRIAAGDEGDEKLREFAFDGTKAMLKATQWELLEGPVERVPAGRVDGEDVYAYLWPAARPAAA